MKNTILLVLLGIIHLNGFSQDWPDWRGVNRDAVWEGSGMVELFDSDVLDIKWSTPIGPGYSGPTVSGGRVYVTDRLERPSQAERVLCFDEQSGEQIWVYQYDCEYESVGYPAGPRTSVVINDGKAYSMGTMGHLFCFDTSTGKVLWKKELNSEYEINMPIWGLASTPLVVDDKLIVHVSGSPEACVVAFNKNTGEEIWRSLEDRAGYSAPILVEKNGVQLVVNWTEHSLSGLDPETGLIYWRFPWTTGSGMSISTPVLYKDHIFVSAFYSGSLLVNLGDDYTTAEIVWQRIGESERNTDALHCVMNTPVIKDDFIYGVDSYGELRCLEFSTGDRVWEDLTAVEPDRWANIHFIQQGDNTWMFNEQGELLITRLSPGGMKEISRAKLIEPTRKQLARGVTWSHPAFANNHVFIRNDERLVCADLSANGQHPGLRVAMVQMDIADGNLTENMLRAEKYIREAAGKKVDLICLPEAADLGWLYQNARADAQPIPGKYTDILSSLAKELNVWISAGCLEKDVDKTYNSAVLIDRSGEIVLKHRKIKTLPELTDHLYDPGSTEDIEVVDTEFGRVGLTICADNFDIANPQKVSDMGAWLLITPHGFAAEESNQVDNAVSFINQIKHIAKTTELWVVGTDAGLSMVTGGAWKGQQHSGCSTIADPTGRAVVFGKFREADLVIYNIPPEE